MYSGIVGAIIVFVISSYFTWLGLIVIVEAGDAVKVLNCKDR